MNWPMYMNDREPDCGAAAAGHAILLWTGIAPSDADIQLADDQFSSAGGNTKFLSGWKWRGIDGIHLGGYARMKPSQIGDAVARFGCAFVVFDSFRGVGPHAVLAIANNVVVSWGQEYTGIIDPKTVQEAYAISLRWHPILLWWSITNFWLRFQ